MELLERCEEEFFEEIDRDGLAGSSQNLVGTPAPREVLAQIVSTLEQLAAVIANVEPRWRLDVILGLQDYLDT